jgi:predicted nuclease with TOPRIM domain
MWKQEQKRKQELGKVKEEVIKEYKELREQIKALKYERNFLLDSLMEQAKESA